MKIGVVKEIKEEEYRVALTPGGAQALVQAGHDVLVQAGAGAGSGFTDEAYARAGAQLVSAGAAWSTDLVLKVISFNLVWAFRHDVLPSEWRPVTIRTLRNLLLRVPGVLCTHAGQWYVRLASWYKHQEVFAEIRGRVDAMAP